MGAQSSRMKMLLYVTQWSEELGNDANGKAILSGSEASGRVEGWWWCLGWGWG